MKIFISGVSGTGKTTLAKYISQRFRIPFVEGSSKVLWEKHKIDCHLDIVRRSILTPKWGIEFQEELLAYRKELIVGLDSFVTDRSPLDNMVYFLLQNAPYVNTDDTEVYFNDCIETYPDYYTQIFLDFNSEDNMIWERDGIRIDNIPYQDMVNTIFMYIINTRPIQNVKLINQWNWERRVSIVEDLIKQEPNLWYEIRRMFGQ